MRMDMAIARSESVAGAAFGRARPIGDFAVVCILSIAGLILAALGLALVGFEQLAQILAATG